MNTYNENLQQTVVNTLSAIALSQSNLASLKTVSEFTLYYAQGAELTARDKLERTNQDITTWQNINNQSLINANQAFNLLTSATDANADVAVSITNTATAAANVQIASNAISALASDVGAAFNIATASLYQTDVYEKIQSANSLINEVANESKRIAKDAMNASSHTSEITIADVLAQTTSAKSKIDTLFKSTQAELDKFSKLAITENTLITKASKAERQAEGGLFDARKEVEAIDIAYLNANNQLNQYLSINVVSGFEITVSFAALLLPTFYSPQAAIVPIPSAEPIHYYLTIIPAQNQTMFSIDQVEQLFVQRPVGDNSQFFAVTPDVSVDAADRVTRIPTTIPLTKDAYGNSIEAGASYVAYLFIELSKSYKQFISNYSDLLSAPSPAFTPATTLPLAKNLVATPGAKPDANGLTWSSALFQSAPIALSAEMAATQAVADAKSANLEAAAAAADAAIAIDAAVAAAEAAAEIIATMKAVADSASADATNTSATALNSAVLAATAAKDAAAAVAAVTAAAKSLADVNAAATAAKAAADKEKSVSDAATHAAAASAAIQQQANNTYQSALEAEKADPNPDTKATLAVATTALETATREAALDAAAAAAAQSSAEVAESNLTKANALIQPAKEKLSDLQKVAANAAKADAKAAKQASQDAAAANADAAESGDAAHAAAKAAATAASAAASAAVATEKANASAINAAAANAAAAAAAAAAAKAAALGTPNPSTPTLSAAAALQAAQLEFRCILVEESGSPVLDLLLCSENQNAPPIYFNRAIAQQVSPANYISAQTAPGGYLIKFSPIATDNFGNMIKPDTQYKPYVLTLAGGDSSDQAKFTTVLKSFSPITVCTHSKN